MPGEDHRETPESGDLVDAEVSAPREEVQGAFVAELRLRTAVPTAPIRAGSTALPSVVATVHTMSKASKAVAAPSPWCSTKASNVPFPRALAEGSRIVASLAPLGIHSAPTAEEMPSQKKGSTACHPAGVVESVSPRAGKTPRADHTARATAAMASKRPRVTFKGILL
jgi:hypothetical protein